MKSYLNTLLNDLDSKHGKYFAFFIQFLIVLSLVSISLESVSSLNENYQQVFRSIEIFTIAVFTVEYILRTYAAENKRKFIFSWYGVIDILAIIPFYFTLLFAANVDLRVLRAFRLLRLFRIFKVVKYNKSIDRLLKAIHSIKTELVMFLIVTIITLFISASIIYMAEYDAQPDKFSSVFHSLWWAVTTLTTVGYGDMYPVTVLGKIFSFIILMLGLGIVAVPTGLISSALVQQKSEEEEH